MAIRMLAEDGPFHLVFMDSDSNGRSFGPNLLDAIRKGVASHQPFGTSTDVPVFGMSRDKMLWAGHLGRGRVGLDGFVDKHGPSLEEFSQIASRHYESFLVSRQRDLCSVLTPDQKVDNKS